MILERLQIQQFRNLQSVSLIPAAGLNVMYGINGSGKSSLLEAIHYLGFGRSFRSARHQHVIQHDADSFTVFCKAIDEESTQSAAIGYQRLRNGESIIRVNGEQLNRASDLVKLLPVQIFTPNSAEVIHGAPSLRRRFLDWGLFHVEQSFLTLNARYQQILAHRNALLRKGVLGSEGAYWNESLAVRGEQVDKLRESYLDRLAPYIYANLSHFLPEFSFEISYYSGWDRSKSLADVLNQNMPRDLKYGFTSQGPHKADLRVKADGIIAQEVLSRGQARMLMAALLLSQSQYLLTEKRKGCVFLLDDIGAELDSAKREAFISELLNSSAQIFVTAVEKQHVGFVEDYKDKKMFHVEHGQVKEE